MSRTKRKIFKGGWEPSDGKYLTEGGDAWVDHHRYGNRKMKPYSKEKSPIKYKASKSEWAPPNKSITKNEKLSTKNANRSLKKGFRQQLKRELKEELENNE